VNPLELELKVPPAELVDAERLRVDSQNPNQQGKRQFKALKESIKLFGFVAPIITNRDLLVADSEHRLRATLALGNGSKLYSNSFSCTES
jgi:ParB-like chromosome segregation protein Spo0J